METKGQWSLSKSVANDEAIQLCEQIRWIPNGVFHGRPEKLVSASRERNSSLLATVMMESKICSAVKRPSPSTCAGRSVSRPSTLNLPQLAIMFPYFRAAPEHYISRAQYVQVAYSATTDRSATYGRSNIREGSDIQSAPPFCNAEKPAMACCISNSALSF